MASTKNVQALNIRLELACRNRVGEFYRQHVSSLAQLEHDKLDTVRLLQSVKKCPSNEDPLSVKFLGPAPKLDYNQRRQEHHHQRTQRHPGNQGLGAAAADDPSGTAAAAAAAPSAGADDAIEPDARLRQLLRGPPQTAAPTSENPFAPAANSQYYFPFLQQPQQQQQQPLDRSKTFAAGDSTQQHQLGVGPEQPQQQLQPRSGRHRSRRLRTPFSTKKERFYTHLESTKQTCGLQVVDSTQTEEAKQFCRTLTQAEWRAKLAKLDPEYFKNLEDGSTDSEESALD